MESIRRLAARLMHLHERYGGSQQERGIWFHGTSSTFARQIMSQGLVPDAKNKTWDQGSSKAPLQTSLPGVYLGAEADIAWYTAERAADKFKGEPMIVAVDVQPRSLWSDENWISRVDLRDLAAEVDVSDSEQILPQHAQEFVALVLTNWEQEHPDVFSYLQGKPQLYKQVSSYLAQSFPVVLSAAAERDTPGATRTMGQASTKYRQVISQLSRTLKDAARSQAGVASTDRAGRIDRPIGFSGSNRIVGVYIVHREQGEAGMWITEILFGQPGPYQQFVRSLADAGIAEVDLQKVPLVTHAQYQQFLAGEEI